MNVIDTNKNHFDLESDSQSIKINNELKKVFYDSFLKIAVVGKSNLFLPYREALVDAINNFGFEAKGFDSIEYDYNPDVFLIINPFHFNYHEFKYKDFIYAGIQTEQIVNNEVYNVNMGIPNYKKLQKYIKRFDLIFEWSPAAARFLRSKYDNIYFFPHCNFKSMRYIENYQNTEEKYDLFFTGWATGIGDRRKNILKVLTENFKVYPKFENLWGAEKEKAILSSKICLNIHFDNSLVYESPRMYEYLANKKFVLTEKISDSYPFIEGEDYESFYIHNMIHKIEYYLSNSKERNKIALNGYKKINQYMLDDHIGEILERFLLEKWARKSTKWKIKNMFFHKLGFLNKKF